MDFLLSLTHFCEVHGPKSVLCTRVLPVDCAICLPKPPATVIGDSPSIKAAPATATATPPPLPTTNTDPVLTSPAAAEAETPSPGIEKHPLFRPEGQQQSDYSPRRFRYGRAQGDICASCSFTIPKEVADKLPDGAPGSLKADGKTRNGGPVLRSRELVSLGGEGGSRSGTDTTTTTTTHSGGQNSDNHDNTSQPTDASHFHHPSTTTVTKPNPESSTPPGHLPPCHDHNLTYLTAKFPDSAPLYSRLRAAVIRTLSFELLPHGMSDGPLCFGDATTGYTIAYVFRLPDPKARGRRRAYAFVALAGKDTSRAFRASPLVWEAFAALARGIEEAAVRFQEEQQRGQREKENAEGGGGEGGGGGGGDAGKDGKPGVLQSKKKEGYTPVSSFLTQRTNDPDGHPRRIGQVTPRSLAEIVGNEYIFVYIHRYFVAVLRSLSEFGGPYVLANSLDEGANGDVAGGGLGMGMGTGMGSARTSFGGAGAGLGVSTEVILSASPPAMDSPLLVERPVSSQVAAV